MGSHHTITARQDRVREFVSPIVIERVHPLKMQHTSTHKPPQKNTSKQLGNVKPCAVIIQAIIHLFLIRWVPMGESLQRATIENPSGA